MSLLIHNVLQIKRQDMKTTHKEADNNSTASRKSNGWSLQKCQCNLWWYWCVHTATVLLSKYELAKWCFLKKFYIWKEPVTATTR